MQYMMVRFRTNINCNQRPLRRPLLRFTPRDEIWSRSPNSILHDVRDEGSEGEADEEAKDGDVGFMCSGSEYYCPHDDDD